MYAAQRRFPRNKDQPPFFLDGSSAALEIRCPITVRDTGKGLHAAGNDDHPVVLKEPLDTRPPVVYVIAYGGDLPYLFHAVPCLALDGLLRHLLIIRCVLTRISSSSSRSRIPSMAPLAPVMATMISRIGFTSKTNTAGFGDVGDGGLQDI
jgi:hypothetical protein